jgi:predicted DNA-binding protein
MKIGVRMQTTLSNELYARLEKMCAHVSDKYIPMNIVFEEAVEHYVKGWEDKIAAKGISQEVGCKVVTFDLKDIHEGACHILKLGKGKVCVCKEKGLIKLFEIELEE